MLNYYSARNRDFINSYYATYRQLPKNHKLTQVDIVKQVIYNEAPSYYVTFSTAYRALRQLRQGRNPPGKGCKLHMWQELALKTDRCKTSLGIRSDYEALSVVLSRSKASRYFITPYYAIKLIRNILHENKTKAKARNCNACGIDSAGSMRNP